MYNQRNYICMGIKTIKSKMLIATYIGSYIKCTHNLNTNKDAGYKCVHIGVYKYCTVNIDIINNNYHIATCILII